VPLHVPGHKRGRALDAGMLQLLSAQHQHEQQQPPGPNVLSYDLTELAGQCAACVDRNTRACFAHSLVSTTAAQRHSHTATQPHSHTAAQPHSHTAAQPHSHTATPSSDMHPGLDFLSSPSSVIQDAQQLAAAALGAERTWFLVNGCSAGIHAAVMAAVRPGQALLLARNCHLSAFSACVLADCVPVWLQPEQDAVHGVAHCITPQELQAGFAAAEQRGLSVGAVLLVSPTYFGAVARVAGALAWAVGTPRVRARVGCAAGRRALLKLSQLVLTAAPRAVATLQPQHQHARLARCGAVRRACWHVPCTWRAAAVGRGARGPPRVPAAWRPAARPGCCSGRRACRCRCRRARRDQRARCLSYAAPAAERAGGWRGCCRAVEPQGADSDDAVSHAAPARRPCGSQPHLERAPGQQAEWRLLAPLQLLASSLLGVRLAPPTQAQQLAPAARTPARLR
jgi:hypothetical protein